jgi:lipopolysaccharide export system permease protein
MSRPDIASSALPRPRPPGPRLPRLSLSDLHIGRLTRIERYVTLQTLMSVAGALAIIAAIVMLIVFVDVSKTVGGRVDLTMLQILTLTLLKSPSVLLLLLPFAFLFGVVGAFVNFNRRSELIAMRAAGVSAWHFIFPAAAAAFLLGVVTVIALNPLAAFLNSEYERATAGFTSDGQISGGAGGPGRTLWLRQGDSRSQVVIEARSRDAGTGHLRDVTMYLSTRGAHGLEFSRRIDAREASLHQGFWLLAGAREAAPGEQAISYESLTLPSTLNPIDAFAKLAAPASVPFWGLPGAIHKIESAGFSATPYRLRFDQLLATPLLFAAMSILGAAFSLRLMRLGGLAMLAASGVALGFAVFFFNQFCGALGKGDVIPPFLAAWSPPVLALLSAFTLLCYTEDG